jgi:hypothetical protein
VPRGISESGRLGQVGIVTVMRSLIGLGIAAVVIYAALSREVK